MLVERAAHGDLAINFRVHQKKIAGKQIKGAQATAISPLRVDKSQLGGNDIGCMMIHVTDP
jgi:hypothetical protein